MKLPKLSKLSKLSKNLIVSLVYIVSFLLLVNSAYSADMSGVVKELNCTACHANDKKVVGPAFNDVKAKYAGDAAAEARLIKKVSQGGAGVWGSMAMPSQDKDLKKQAKIQAAVKDVLGK